MIFLGLLLLFFQFTKGQTIDLPRTAVEYWHSTLSKQLGVDGSHLKLSQGNESVGSTSDWLWNILDAIAVDTPGYYYNPTQYNSFSSDYGLILSETKTPDSLVTKCNLEDAM